MLDFLQYIFGFQVCTSMVMGLFSSFFPLCLDAALAIGAPFFSGGGEGSSFY